MHKNLAKFGVKTFESAFCWNLYTFIHFCSQNETGTC